MTRGSDSGDRARRTSPSRPETAQMAGSSVHQPPPAPAVAAEPARTRRGRLSSKFGTVNYSVDEMRRLNATVRAVLPASADEWLHVAYQFNYLRPDSIPYREVESLKRKFKKMYCARGGGGNGGLPEYLVEAKALRQLINQRSDKAQSEDAQSDAGGALEVDEDAGQQPEAGPEAEARPTPVIADGLQGGGSAVEAETPSLEQQQVEVPVDGLVSRLRQMDEDLQRSVVAAAAAREALREGELQSVAGSQTVSSTPEPRSSTSAIPTTARQALVPPGGPLSTTSIISMLKQSVERKRRSAEEQLLYESARVRKERKKRKMEQALHSIHQEHEQREREASGGVQTTSTASAAEPPSSQVTVGLNHPLFQPPAGLSTAAGVDASGVGLMEIMLQYMTAQQLETARRQEMEDDRQRREELARENRRRMKDRQRRRQHQELMLALSALLGDRFPPSLRHLVDGEQGAESTGEEAAVEGDKQTDAVQDGTSVLL